MPISGFTAVYNPQMMAMMPIQSFIMMYEAGQGWQFGKRKISEKSNEEIKALTPIMLMEQNNQVRKDALPIIQRAMDEIAPITRHMVTNFADIVKEFIAGVGDVAGNIFQQSYQGANNPYGSTQQVRYGIGQANRFKGTFNQDGLSDPSLYQQDVDRERIRQFKKQQEQQFADQRQLQKEAVGRAVKSSTAGFTPSIGKRVSNQTLKIEQARLIRDISRIAKILKATPRTIQIKRKTVIGKAGQTATFRQGSRTMTTINPRLQQVASELKRKQARLVKIINELRTSKKF